MSQTSNGHQIGVDIGGTFTDVVCRAPDGGITILKMPTTRANPSAHLRQQQGVAPADISRFVHGTTAATNAILERKNAPIGLITTVGFSDVLEIGRQKRRSMYDLMLVPETPVFLAPGARRRAVVERIAATGEVVLPLNEAQLLERADELVMAGAEAIAICFLFSFINPIHELRARELIEAKYPEVMIFLSCEVDPAFREYERTCVTAFDAAVKPVLDRYLADMETDLADAGIAAPLQVMQSRGGICSAAIARRRPVRLLLSGPAAGVIGGRMAGALVGVDDLITLDMGGTSCDIALVSKRKPVVRAESVIGGYPIRVPMVEVNAIGAGGSSIAWLDSAGGLRIGPHSAGSEPGPACYDRGGAEPTVTGASLVLGYINPDRFAGGVLRLEPDRAAQSIAARIAEPLRLTVQAAALGIHRILNAQMAEGIRLVSIRRGFDPRAFALVAMGGAGPLHGCALAEALGITRIIVPRYPGVLSACGLLAAPVEHEVSAAFPRDLEGLEITDLRAGLDELDTRCGALMASEGVDPHAVRVDHFADVCYIGQGYDLEVPVSVSEPGDPIERLYQDFLATHDRIYGHSTENPARIINLRSVHYTDGDEELGMVTGAPQARATARRRIHLTDPWGIVEATIFQREDLVEGAVVAGPAIVKQADTTTLIEPGWRGRSTADGTLVLAREE